MMDDAEDGGVGVGLKYAQWLERHAWPVLLVALGVVLGCAVLASRLTIRTDFAELLPSADPSIRELRRAQKSLPGNEPLIVNIASDTRETSARFADALAERVRQLPASSVSLALSNIKAERDWFTARQALYINKPDLEALRDALRRQGETGLNPFVVDLDASPSESLENILKRLQSDTSKEVGPQILHHLGDGYFGATDSTTLSVVVLPPGGQFREHAGETIKEQVVRIVAELQPAHPGVREIGYSGDIESNLEERDALENDLVLATGVSVILVAASIILFFGRPRLLFLVSAPAFMGAIVAYAVAALSFGYLNSSTAFLGSIILGNGINFAIIQMSRYEEERRRGLSVTRALGVSIRSTVSATGVAACAAALSYGSLTLTQFRGFSQFGIIGGTGILVAWLSTLIVLPAAVWLSDGRSETAPQRHRERGRWLAAALAHAATGQPMLWIAGAAVASVVACTILPNYLRDPFEYNFRNLRSAVSDDTTRGESRWLASNTATFGRALNPLVVLLHGEASTEPTRAALLEADQKDGGLPLFDRIVALQDFLPGSVADQRSKLPVLDEIRTLLTGPTGQRLPAALRKKLAPFVPPADLQAFGMADLPAVLRHPFTELDGSIGRVLLLFPKQGTYKPWDGRDMLRLSDRVAEIDLPDGSTERAVGGAVIFAGMIRSILRDGPLASVAAAGGVIALVFLVLRRNIRGACVVLGTLLAGMIWMMGGAALMGVRINFLNFVAVPVTLGIGIDYGINIFMRAELDGPDNLQASIKATGGAVVLCSLTTIIGYGALLVADNRGLRSFGTLAILGEIACLIAALAIMPAVLSLRQHIVGHQAKR